MMMKLNDENLVFTCLSCSIAFPTADAQREHYRSDHHKYNMKRRVASLPPVSANIFNQKVLDRQREMTNVRSSEGSVCEVCSKRYTTENAYKAHLRSKKHRENDSLLKAGRTVHKEAYQPPEIKADNVRANEATDAFANDGTADSLAEDDMQRVATTRSFKDCLFCPTQSTSLEENISHMTIAHSFFVPDCEYLTDMAGLITYLGEKIVVGNICIYCNLKSREFRSIEAVRKHMVDKSHCKIAYDSETDRLEISDYYDFSPSYPDIEERNPRKSEVNLKEMPTNHSGPNDEWEDIEDEDNMEVDEIVDESTHYVLHEKEGGEGDLRPDSDDDLVPENQLKFGDTIYELVLPSGARIGHREMRRYYAQSLPRVSLAAHNGKDNDSKSGAALVRRLLTDKRSALVPRKGGFGAFGSGTEVVKARNRGEAREAGRHIREFRDQKRREELKTRVAFGRNHQKHYRDPLLQ